jgi:hypothetical protein
MLQILENHHNYIEKHKSEPWDFHVFQLIYMEQSALGEINNLRDWIDHPFMYDCGIGAAFGYLPCEAARKCCNDLDCLFHEYGATVILESGITPSEFGQHLYHPDEFWMSLIHFDLHEIEEVRNEIEHRLDFLLEKPAKSGELDRLLECVLKDGIDSLTSFQLSRLNQISDGLK